MSGGVMAEPIDCPKCQRPLADHCPRGCGWLRCSNRNCAADLYDARRRLLRSVDGHVERMA